MIYCIIISKAKDIYQEAKYMYLSHYIDIKSGPRYYVDPSISNDIYLNGTGIAVVPFVRATYSFYSYAFKDFYDKVWWIALIQYNNIRVSNRIMRYYVL